MGEKARRNREIEYSIRPYDPTPAEIEQLGLNDMHPDVAKYHLFHHRDSTSTNPINFSDNDMMERRLQNALQRQRLAQKYGGGNRLRLGQYDLTDTDPSDTLAQNPAGEMLHGPLTNEMIDEMLKSVGTTGLDGNSQLRKAIEFGNPADVLPQDLEDRIQLQSLFHNQGVGQRHFNRYNKQDEQYNDHDISADIRIPSLSQVYRLSKKLQDEVAEGRLEIPGMPKPQKKSVNATVSLLTWYNKHKMQMHLLVTELLQQEC